MNEYSNWENCKNEYIKSLEMMEYNVTKKDIKLINRYIKKFGKYIKEETDAYSIYSPEMYILQSKINNNDYEFYFKSEFTNFGIFISHKYTMFQVIFDKLGEHIIDSPLKLKNINKGVKYLKKLKIFT